MLSEYFNIHREKIKVIPNAIETKDYISRQEVRIKYDIDEKAFVVGMIANYTRYKDHNTAVLAWKIVLETLADTNKNIV